LNTKEILTKFQVENSSFNLLLPIYDAIVAKKLHGAHDDLTFFSFDL